ncbi:MAG: TRAP transporter small permease [Desulfohalobiaceae bacterium]
MEGLERFVYWMSQRLSKVAQTALFLIMLIILGNIIMRYFWAPIKGTYEIVEVLGALFLSLGAAYCAVTRSNIAVDFAVQMLSPKKQTLVDIGTNLIAFLFIAFISWGVLEYAGTVYQRGRETAALGLPLFPVYYLVSLGMFLLALVVLTELIRLILVLALKGGKKE